ncbi:hypothetical protein VTN77DRAFT_6175 [Rasamsonia byssochlamydoides]|uniref:uncharacterized protein n=1 Tax=Rasamsonia byssochlamydoides TaxID=89139 RepID=UPI0037432387
MIEGGYDIDAYDEWGSTSLMLAIMYPHDGLFNLLLEKGASVNYRRGEAGPTVLSMAAEYGTMEMLRRLLDEGAEIKQERDNYAPLLCAAGFGRVDVLSLLLERGASIEATDEAGRTALHEATMQGQNHAIHFLLDEDLGLEAKSAKDGMTALHEAAHWGHLPTMELLLDRGANVNAVDDKGESVVHHAISTLNYARPVVVDGHLERRPIRPRLEMLQLLLSRGADVTILDSNGGSLLHRVIQEYDQPSEIDVEGRCTLEEALKWCPTSGTEAVRLLFSLGLEVNAQGRNGDTPLHRAVYVQNVAIIQLLLEAGANTEVQNNEGATPLFETVNLTAVADNGRRHRRPLWWTTITAVEMLLDAGADVNARKNNGWTVLHQLAENVLQSINYRHYQPAISLLLSRGLDIDAVDANGETAVQMADRLGKGDLAELIRSLSRSRYDEADTMKQIPCNDRYKYQAVH